jgi:hypothetical protein
MWRATAVPSFLTPSPPNPSLSDTPPSPPPSPPIRYVARNGRSFLTGLANRESKNPQARGEYRGGKGVRWGEYRNGVGEIQGHGWGREGGLPGLHVCAGGGGDGSREAGVRGGNWLPNGGGIGFPIT